MKKKSSTDSILRQMFVTRTLGFVDVSEKRFFWSDFAQQTAGIFKIKHTISRDLASLNLVIPIENGQIEFNESDTHPLKVVATVNSDKQIGFAVTKKDYMDTLLKFLGCRYATSFHPDFDSKYVVKCHDEKSVRSILKCESIISLILKTNLFSISCEFDNKKSEIEIISMVGRSVNSINELQDVYHLFRIIIDQIQRL